MSLTNSNTYTEPTAGTSLNTARLQQNDTFRSLLTNFKSVATPSSVNLTAAGAPIGEQDGMLYRSATTNALYISDTVHKKSSPIGGNFTRVGIGNRVENGIVALGANATSYEIGELVATVSENGTLAANSRLYLCVSNTASVGSTARFLDVGIPQGYSVGTLNNVTFSGQSVTAISFLATSNVGIGTSSPTSALDVVGAIKTGSGLLFGATQSYMYENAANSIAWRIGTDGPFVTMKDAGSNIVNLVNVNGPLSLGAANTERIRINTIGRVLLNRTTDTLGGGAGYDLQIGNGAASSGMTFHAAPTSLSDIQFADGTVGADSYRGLIRYDHNTDSLAVWVSASEKLRINSAGNVGIGTTTATNKLTVAGNISTEGINTGILTAVGSATTPTHSFTAYPDIGMFNPSADTLGFSVSGVEQLRVNANGAIGIQGANYGTAGQVLTSQGANTTPIWSDSSGIVFLGTLTTTSGTSQTISGLDLTSYKFVRLVWNDVSHNYTIDTASFRVDTTSVTSRVSATSRLVFFTEIELTTGIANSTYGAFVTTVTNASTSITISPSAGQFDSGSVNFYGMR